MRLLYSILIRMFSGLVTVAGLFGNKKASKWSNGRKNQWYNFKSSGNDKWLWMHVSSLGEFEQGLPVLEKLKTSFPQYKILLTFFSPSGYEMKKDLELVDKVAYLPSDTVINAKRLLRNFNIKAAFFVKYEFWFNYIKVLNDNDIPLYYISVLLRDGQYFFKFYGYWFRKHLKMVRHFFVQNDNTALLLKKIGIDCVTVTGDTRFDRVYDIAHQTVRFPNIETFIGNRKCIIAGSSWPSDEELLFPFIAKMPDDYCMIIAPHDVSLSHVSQIEKGIENCQLYTELNSDNHSKVLIINVIGVLSKIYRYARFAYIGGGFYTSIHNIQEAVVYDCPVVFGPKHEKFVEAVELKRLGGAFAVNNAEEFNDVFEHLVSDDGFCEKASQVCHDYVAKKIGATDKIITLLENELK